MKKPSLAKVFEMLELPARFVIQIAQALLDMAMT
jgi:hypothetical protein